MATNAQVALREAARIVTWLTPETAKHDRDELEDATEATLLIAQPLLEWLDSHSPRPAVRLVLTPGPITEQPGL